METVQNKTLDLRFYSDNGLIQRNHNIADVHEVHSFVDQFIKYIDRDGLFDVTQATERMISTGFYENGQLVLRLNSFKS